MNEDLARGVIRHRRRVQGIAFQKCLARLLQVLIRPFPELKNLEISPVTVHDKLGLPTTFLSGFALSLRRLSLHAAVLNYLSPLLSSTTNLVELALTLNKCGSVPEALLIENLQFMSCLRRLELMWRYIDRDDDTPQAHQLPPANTGDIVPLPKLTDLIFDGRVRCLEMLVVALTMPSLQHLNAEIWRGSLTFTGVQHLFKFICDGEVSLSRFPVIEARVFCGDDSQIRPCSNIQNNLFSGFCVGADYRKRALWVSVHCGGTDPGMARGIPELAQPHSMGRIFQPFSAGEEGSGAIRVGTQCCAFPQSGRPLASS